MNWVGGSRNRYMMRNDMEKQREFFKKRKMQQKLKNMGIQLPASPKCTSSGSMDLVTLFIVNQIAANKEKKDPPKITLLNDSKGGPKAMRNKPLELPMSPCSPSRLRLVESQPQYSVQGMRKRKHCIPEGFKCRQLSPVLESAFSDNSASDYQPHIPDTLSPFSSISTVSSGQGIFSLQPNLQQRGQTQAHPHCSPPPWDTSGLEQAKFRPFSQPRAMRDCTPWSSGSNTPQYQPDTPTVARVLFGSPEPDSTKVRDHERHEVRFSLNQPEDKESMLGFTLNQSQTEEQFGEELFMGFNNEECESEAPHFGRSKSKLYLKGETPSTSSRIQNTIDSQCRGPEDNSSTQLSNCAVVSSSCPGPSNGPLRCCELSPCYSSRGGYFSSDSDGEVEGSAYMDRTFSVETPNPNQGSQWTPQQELSQHGPLTLQKQCPGNCRDDQEVMKNMCSPDGPCEWSNRQTRSSEAQFVSSRPMALSHSPEIRRRKSTETRDAGTQTADIPARQTSDASTQCGLLPETTKAIVLGSTPVGISTQIPATRGQDSCRDAATEQNAQRSSSASCRRGEEHTPWNKSIKKYRLGHLSVNSIIKKCPAHNTVTKQRPSTPIIHGLTDDQETSRQVGGGRGERGTQDLVENGPLIKELGEDKREEVTSASRVNKLSGEVETLQEIAGILLMLKQRRSER